MSKILQKVIKTQNFNNKFPIPKIGDTVTVEYLTSNKDKKRFKGVVISKRRENSPCGSFDVLKTHADEGLRLHRTFFIFCPSLSNVTIESSARKNIRRSKLMYLKSLHGKKARI